MDKRMERLVGKNWAEVWNTPNTNTPNTNTPNTPQVWNTPNAFKIKSRKCSVISEDTPSSEGDLSDTKDKENKVNDKSPDKLNPEDEAVETVTDIKEDTTPGQTSTHPTGTWTMFSRKLFK